MGLFDLFKKKKEETKHYDVTNIKVTDLAKNFVLDYDLDSWIVEEEYEYDWGDQNFTHEYKIFSGEERRYLHLENDSELEIALTEKISINMLDRNIKSTIINNDKPLDTIFYEGTTYFLDAEYPGFFRNMETDESDSQELIMWLYLDKTEEKLINIFQWGENDFDARIGTYLDDYEISNILPGKE